MLLRERQTDRGLLVSVCDADILGESFENGQVSLTVTESFYGGDDAEEVDADAMVEGLRRASIANLVGDECIDAAVAAGLVDEETVIDVGGTRHAQLLWVG